MKLTNILTVTALALTLVTACEYDDTALTGRVEDLENRVTDLEKKMQEFQTSVDECVALINQYRNESRIESFSETPEGYVITFADGKGTMTLKHGTVPSLGVSYDQTLGEYVWTADNNVIKDKDGNPVRAYIAPVFEVRDGKLGYTLNDEWHEVMNGESVGLITDVVETSEGVTFVLSSGSPITIPKVGFRLQVDFFEYGAKPGQTVNLEYSLYDADDNAEVLVYPDAGFTVANVSRYGAEITLPADEAAAYSGKVLLVAVNGNGATSAKIVRFGSLVTEVTSADVVKIGRKGGLVSFNVRSNRPYNLMLQGDPDNMGLPPTWLMPSDGPETRAPREDVIWYDVQPMPADMQKDRKATFKLEWRTNIKEEQEDWENQSQYNVVKELVVMQLDTRDIDVANPKDKDGNPVEFSSGAPQIAEGILDDGWTFVNGAFVSAGERRFALNGLLLKDLDQSVAGGKWTFLPEETKMGKMTSEVYEDGIGTLFMEYGIDVARARSAILTFRVECFDAATKAVLWSEDIVQEKPGGNKTHFECNLEINQSKPCYLVITNIADEYDAKNGGEDHKYAGTVSSYKGKTYNAVVIHQAYTTRYKAPATE